MATVPPSFTVRLAAIGSGANRPTAFNKARSFAASTFTTAASIKPAPVSKALASQLVFGAKLLNFLEAVQKLGKMESFFIISKTIGDLIFPVLGIFVGLCAVSKSLTKWVRKREASMKASSCQRRIFGSVLIIFCSLYLWSSAHIQISQSKEQSSVYQKKIALKYEAEALAKHLLELSPDAQNEFFISDDFSWLQRVDEDLLKQGLNTDKLKQIYRKSGITPETLKQMSDELKRLADQLPNNQ